jgi:uncharacterized protein YyaL (SSP411 family)
MPNRLIHETSPYLLQHAHNPVDWYPWGEAAFARARGEDKPVFLSIGYSACHWCHVMERESFENEAIAEMLNRDFVAIKVDREERPDIDSIYMQAVQLMTGQGGWPMSMFLTPDARPFYGGTYFPPEDRYGAPGFKRVLQHVVETYRLRRKDVEEAGDEVRRAVNSSLQAAAGTAPIEQTTLDAAAARIAHGYDTVNGGFGGAPKFPPSMTLDFLMQVAWRHGEQASRLRSPGVSPGDDSSAGMPGRGDPGAAGEDACAPIILNTLTKMASGGMYDQIGGGFHRYSTDARWLVPHFEKMLYDNALLARLYTRAWQWTHEPFFARIANEILQFVAREMTSPDGGFYSTLDADSEGEEGKFYVWSRAEVLEILGDQDGPAFCALLDVTERGNWEGHNIPNVPRAPEAVAADLGISVDRLTEIVVRGKAKLYEVRSKRIWPARDEKILSSWNGWMLAVFAEASLAFDDYREIVRRNADFLLTRIDANDRLTRHAHIAGLLEDYAGVAWGLTLAYEALHDRRYLDAARDLLDQILTRFRDEENGGFFDTPVDHEALITRPKDVFDNATPGGNSIACEVLLRHALLFGREDYVEIATRTIESILPLAQRFPSAFGFLLGVAEWRTGQPREIAITGDAASVSFHELQRTVGQSYLPHRVLVAGGGSSDLPLMQNRPMDRVTAYVCQGYACQEPTSDPGRLAQLLR